MSLPAPVVFIYNAARTPIESGAINLLTAPVYGMLVNNQYASSENNDVYVSAIPHDSIVVRDYPVLNPSMSTSGFYRSTLAPFNSLLSPLTVYALILYVKNSTDAASPLLYYSAGGSGFPFLPQGFDYVVGYDQSTGGWFQP